ncbi:Hpt domain-containing protein [Oceanispirochaeta crateris]|uniref:Hpt domain-containing protein n=1 Tax=Oceanispirochaeta crateris TaxID=2518645 RepID=A0A5C1QLN0_9SPIO|nr:Hpt domain-containing protein [Oceanispirochaeta crateris]QEN07446.1 Hpt domain-containing protein [Oceanispirochaeta crateris]
MSDFEIFKMTNLLHYTDDDRELASEMIRMALQDMPEFLKKTEDCLVHQKMEEAGQFLHKIKGISGVIGAEKVHVMSCECELSVKTNSNDLNVLNLVRNLGLAIDQFCEENDVQILAGTQ